MIKTESIFTEEYLNNIKIATGTKATLLQPEGKMLIPVVKLYTSERTGKWIYSGIFGYFPFFLLRSVEKGLQELGACQLIIFFIFFYI